MISQPAASGGTRRNEAIDFFRGVGLCMILVDHLQPNVCAHFTLAQLGFSDFAEVFVFLSGYVNAGMYERALQSGGIAAALKKLRARAAKLYLAHLATMAASFAILAACASHGLRLDKPGLYVWVGEPARYLAQALSLVYCPYLYSLLPLFIILAPFTLAAVVALRRWPGGTLACSFALWCIGRSRSAEFHVFTAYGAWSFNPVAWQFLFVIGAAAKMYWPVVRRAAESRTLQGVAIAVVLASFLLKTASLIGPVQRWLFSLTPLFTSLLARDAGKCHLAPFRVVHFLSLLVLIVAIPRNWRKGLESRVARVVIAGGRDSLFIYSVSLVLTTALNLILTRWDGGPLLQIACTALGLGVLCGLVYGRDQAPVRFDLQPEQSRE